MLLSTSSLVWLIITSSLLFLAICALIFLLVRKLTGHGSYWDDWPPVLAFISVFVGFICAVAVGFNLSGGATASAINHDLHAEGYQVSVIWLDSSQATVMIDGHAQLVDLYKSGVPHRWRAYVPCPVDPSGHITTESCTTDPQ